MTDGTRIDLKLPKLKFNHDKWPNTEDKLNRQPEIENLSHILLNVQSPLVFALEAPWGDGKSTFVKLWEQYLAYNKKAYVTLNAWESDFCEDPMLPLLSAFDKWVDQQSGYSVGKRAWGKAKKMAPGVLKSIAVSGVKAGTLGALDLNDAVEGALSEVAGGITGDIVDAFNQRLSLLEQFKGALKGALDLLPEGQENLIVFVDELDRCRPSYAIELLERIKHLFDVEGVVFVLSMNREQLGNSLGGIYGSNFDGIKYLRRFVDIDYQLRIPDVESYVNSKLYQSEILNRAKSNKVIGEEIDFLKVSIAKLAEKYSMSMRDINQMIIRIRLIFKSIPRDHHLNPHLLVLLLFLREFNRPLYEELISDPSSIWTVIESMFHDEFSRGVIPRYIPILAGKCIGLIADQNDREEIFSRIGILRNDFKAGEDPYKMVSKMIDIAKVQDGWDGEALLKLVSERIEISKKMTF